MEHLRERYSAEFPLELDLDERPTQSGTISTIQHHPSLKRPESAS